MAKLKKLEMNFLNRNPTLYVSVIDYEQIQIVFEREKDENKGIG